MRTRGVLFLLLIGATAGALLQKPLARLLPAPVGQSAELRSDDKGGSEEKDQHRSKDKRMISVDPDIAKLLGIEIATAEPGVMPTEVQVTGTIGFNEDKLARIVPRAAGVVRRVLKNVGDQAKAGEVLATLDSKDVAEAKAVYLAAKDKLSLAETTFNREDMLFNRGVSSEQDRINAQRALAQARSDMRSATQSVLTLGFRDADLERLAIEPIDLSRVDIMAPFAGEVIEKHIFTGEYLPQDREVFAVADLRRGLGASPDQPRQTERHRRRSAGENHRRPWFKHGRENRLCCADHLQRDPGRAGARRPSQSQTFVAAWHGCGGHNRRACCTCGYRCAQRRHSNRPRPAERIFARRGRISGSNSQTWPIQHTAD